MVESPGPWSKQGLQCGCYCTKIIRYQGKVGFGLNIFYSSQDEKGSGRAKS